LRLFPLVILTAMWCSPALSAQQVADTAFHPPVPHPAFSAGRGPVVAVDAGHHNFHTADGRYAPFASLLARDGFTVRSLTQPFSPRALDGVRVLVVANALNAANAERWALPTPSAFTSEEIAAVRGFVWGGGALLLIADHMPFPGAAAELAAAFDFQMANGFAMPPTSGPLVFRRTDGTLVNDPITRGRGPDERVDSVATFTGQAFQGPGTARPLLVLPKGVTLLLPDEAWQFDSTTRRADATGWWQGAVRTYGRGRVAVFGEAAMFSAQRAGPASSPMGMNAPIAAENPQFLLNVMHWLVRALPD
jgi:hypothetical protein